MIDSHARNAIADLVKAGRITAEQADEVLGAIFPAESAQSLAPWRQRLVEAAAYVGAVFVGVALFVLTAQNWGNLQRGGQLGVLGGLALLGATVAGITLGTCPGGRSGLFERPGRRRLASVMAVTSATCLAASAAVLSSSNHTHLVVSLVGLIALVIAHQVAPSLLTEVGMFAFSTSLVYALRSELQPRFEPVFTGPFNSRPPLSWFDQAFPLVTIGLGLAWAMLISRWLRVPGAARVLGLASAFIAAFAVVVDDRSRVEGLFFMAFLAALALGQYLRSNDWQWLPTSIASLTVFMFQLVGGSNSPVIGFLAAGLVLLAASGVALWRGRRNRPTKHVTVSP